MAHQCDCDFEAGKRECEVFYLQHSCQRHIIVHTGLTTDFESFHVQQVNHLIFTVFTYSGSHQLS